MGEWSTTIQTVTSEPNNAQTISGPFLETFSEGKSLANGPLWRKKGVDNGPLNLYLHFL